MYPKKPPILLTNGRLWSALALTRRFGRLGYEVEIVDSSRFALSCYSKYCRRFHKAPRLTEHPHEFAKFIIELVKKRDYEFVVPVFEEVFVIAKVRDEIALHTKLLVADYDTLMLLHNKTRLYEFCLKNNIATPFSIPLLHLLDGKTTFDNLKLPIFLKYPFGCGSSGTHKASTLYEFKNLVSEHRFSTTSDHNLHPLLQSGINGYQIATQAVYKQGNLLALHMYRNIIEYPVSSGTGVVRESVFRDDIKLIMEKLGSILSYDGFLGIDFIIDKDSNQPFLIDANPRVPLGIYNSCLSNAALPEAYAAAIYDEPTEVASYTTGLRSRFMVFHVLWLLQSILTRKASFWQVLHDYILSGKSAHPEVWDCDDMKPCLMTPVIVIRVIFAKGKNIMNKYLKGCVFTLNTYIKLTD